jgi:hypothetical protein
MLALAQQYRTYSHGQKNQADSPICCKQNRVEIKEPISLNRVAAVLRVPAEEFERLLLQVNLKIEHDELPISLALEHAVEARDSFSRVWSVYYCCRVIGDEST